MSKVRAAQSIHADRLTTGREYRQLVAHFCDYYETWADVPEAERARAYDCMLRRDGFAEAWTALTDKDDDRGEGRSALYAIRDALLAPSATTLDRVLWGFRQNLEAFYSDSLQDDFEAEHARRLDAQPRRFFGGAA